MHHASVAQVLRLPGRRLLGLVLFNMIALQLDERIKSARSQRATQTGLLPTCPSEVLQFHVLINRPANLQFRHWNVPD